VSVIDADFVHGADYAALNVASRTFKGMIGTGARVFRGSGDKEKQAPVASFAEAIDWLMKEADNAVSRQRYKGLGEMNPGQLWETTMDPAVRRMLRVQIEDAIGADQIFTTLMGDDVEPRRQFIETNALYAGNIDV
jgi:DNA gyrase subunit B